MRICRQLLKIFGILFSSLLLGIAVNAVHPRGIPLVQDWDNYVESKALKAGIRIISLSNALFLSKQSQSLFVDARSGEEFERGTIPGAVSLPFQKLEDSFETVEAVLTADGPVIVYCSSRQCDDALYLAIELQAIGVTNLHYMADGFDAWKGAGWPVEMP